MKKYRRAVQIVFVFLLALGAWYVGPVLSAGDPVVAKQAWPMIDQGALLIDVRTQEEFADGHIAGSINIPWEETDKLIAIIGPDKQRQVVVYCRSGNRSGKAMVVLQNKGYSGIFNATGYQALKETRP